VFQTGGVAERVMKSDDPGDGLLQASGDLPEYARALSADLGGFALGGRVGMARSSKHHREVGDCVTLPALVYGRYRGWVELKRASSSCTANPEPSGSVAGGAGQLGRRRL